jgi:hypothetical protein
MKQPFVPLMKLEFGCPDWKPMEELDSSAVGVAKERPFERQRPLLIERRKPYEVTLNGFCSLYFVLYGEF